MEVIFSGSRSLSLSISTIESNGLSCKGLKPVANLDVLQNPSEPHLRKLQGSSGLCSFWEVTAAETAGKEREQGSLKIERFFLDLDVIVLQILEVEDTLCIAESEKINEFENWHRGVAG